MRIWLGGVWLTLGVVSAAWVTSIVKDRKTSHLDQIESSRVAFQRAERLRRGINLSGWFAQLSDSPQARDNGYMTVLDIQRLKRLGFDHVRLSIDPAPLIDTVQNGALRPDAMAKLDKAVDDLTGAGLNVVLDVQPEESWKTPLANGDESVEKFFAFWTAFATHYAKTDPEKVFFEVMNEPTMQDLYRWEGIEDRAVARIRSVAPRHTVIATAARFSNIESLIAMEPVHDDNVIYTFHDYDPMWFTHQGATWGEQGWAFVHGVHYPATPENIKPVLAQEPDERERLKLKRFAWEHWDAGRIEAEVETAAEWAKQRGVPLYCGEFGVYKAYAKPEERVRWIADTRTALERKHIGWAMWEYRGYFGLATQGRDGPVIDREALHALGLPK